MNTGDPFRLGVWQDETPTGGLAVVLERIAHALSDARDSSVDLLVFPECFLTGYFRKVEDVPAIASEVDASVLGKLAALARSTGVAFVVGTYESLPEGIANAAHVFLPGAPGPLTYRKRALYGDWEKSVFRNGDAPTLFRYRDLTFAVLICFDVEFPELVREVVQQGADAILVPTALMEPDHEIADFVVPARAIENGVTVAYANRIGIEDRLEFIGKSQICDPLARVRVVAESGSRGLLIGHILDHELPTNYLHEMRSQRLPGITKP